MPSITLNGRVLPFKPGQLILQVANEANIAVPQYCYHDGLSIVASCRICLAEIWMPDAKTGKLAPHMGGKLMPTCQTTCMDGMVVYTDSPKSVANQKAVMEYLLINHPLDCPVCDQAGECSLQDYSYEYGRGASRFEETKVKQAKKDVGPHIYLYSDRCIMCTRCVRFTREVSGTAELLVAGRGNREEIDVFPGQPLANELASNVVDLCPVGALLDKDFLFAQRVWFLKSAPSIDGITASGDNILIEHNEGKVYRVKPRTNMAVNRWWITDEVRYGWKFIHREDRLSGAGRRQFGVRVPAENARADREAVDGLRKVMAAGKRIAVIVSPMLSCEDAYALARAALAIDPKAFLAVGLVPSVGADKVFPAGADPSSAGAFTMYAEKCPNARGVRRVLGALSAGGAHNGYVAEYAQILGQIKSGEIGGVVVTGNYPSDWAGQDLIDACTGAFVVAIDTLPGRLSERADVLLPGATFAEKAGTFENARGMLQAFEAAIPVREGARSEMQIGLDLQAVASGSAAPSACSARIRSEMAAAYTGLTVFTTSVAMPSVPVAQEADMQVVEV
ncbi:MAG: 2Fe-2S iron-sulfur cluster-binding protein [Phycisphaerales bacterium]